MNSKYLPEFILASASLRRQEILSLTGLSFKTFATDIDESINEKISGKKAARKLAVKKADWAVKRLNSSSVIISADTLIDLEGEIMGKPASQDEAKKMLKLLSDKTHTVSTGICVVCKDRNFRFSGTASTRVTFKKFSDAEIDYYVENNSVTEWAGAYAIQGIASLFIRRISGDYNNVVGLPLSLLYDILLKAGYDLHRNLWIS